MSNNAKYFELKINWTKAEIVLTDDIREALNIFVHSVLVRKRDEFLLEATKR
jgi:selenocysteine lyase/cysteine desulfurase